ncbi:MAG: hypothetical protein R3E93_14555 [Thiothrix sp.]
MVSSFDAQIAIPENRIIRKRVVARTIAVHLCAIPSGLRLPGIVNGITDKGYLRKWEIPRQVRISDAAGKTRTLTRDAAWQLIDAAGAELEHTLLTGNAGKAAGFVSKAGQGIYANYGRPAVDYTGFLGDYLRGMAPLRVGSLLIGIDASVASGLTLLGHAARGTPLSHAVVLTDVLSNGAYEGSSSWASAKIGVAAAAKTLGMTFFLSIPAAGVASVLTGFVVGAAAAIATKRAVNVVKNKAVDGVCSHTFGELPYPASSPPVSSS